MISYHDWDLDDLVEAVEEQDVEIAALTMQLESAKLEIIELRNQLENASVRHRLFSLDHLEHTNS